jgi:hypothetical protein
VTVQPDLWGNDAPVAQPKMPEALRRDIDALITMHGFNAIEAAVGQWKIDHSGPIPSAPSRHTDPRTSVGGRMGDVRRFSANSYAGRLLAQFSGAGGLTDSDATIHVLGEPGPGVPFSKWEGCRRRCSDLRAAGYIADTGREHDNRIVWSITLAGELALDKMHLTGWSH